MYPKEMIEPIKAEFNGTKIVELTTPEAVHDFMKKPGTKLLFINSVCGCSGGAARPILMEMQDLEVQPSLTASVFAGFDIDAINTFKTYLLDESYYTSPAFYFFRGSDMVYKVIREEIKGVDTLLVRDHIESVYRRFMGPEINTNIEIADPKKAHSISRKEADGLYAKGPEICTFIDCRTYEERAMNNPYNNSLPLTTELVEEMLETWERDSQIVFYCAHGIRSLAAVEYFKQNGFINTKSLENGVD